LLTVIALRHGSRLKETGNFFCCQYLFICSSLINIFLFIFAFEFCINACNVDLVHDVVNYILNPQCHRDFYDILGPIWFEKIVSLDVFI
jgi:hypothetical protein